MAVAHVSEFLATRGRRRDKLRYDTSAVTHDLRHFLEGFDTADPSYRDTFLAAVNSYLDQVDPQAFSRLPALRRLQWDLVRRGDADRVAELVRFEHHDLGSARATRSGRRWYAEFPGRNDPAVALSDSHFAVRRELRLTSTVDSLEIDTSEVRIRGRAAIDLAGVVERRVQLLAIPQGRGRLHGFRVTVSAGGEYLAELPLTRLRSASRSGRDREWRLIMIARDHQLRRVAAWHELGAAARSAGRILPTAGGSVEIRLALTGRGRLTLATTARPMTVRRLLLDSDVLEVAGETPRPLSAGHLVVAGASAVDLLPLHLEPAGAGSGFLGRLPLRPLAAAGSGSWRVEIVAGGVRRGLAYTGEELALSLAGVGVRIGRGADGYLGVTIG